MHTTTGHGGPVAAGGPDSFVIAAGTWFPGENATFQRLPGGQVASVFLAETTWVRLDPRAAPARGP